MRGQPDRLLTASDLDRKADRTSVQAFRLNTHNDSFC